MSCTNPTFLSPGMLYLLDPVGHFTVTRRETVAQRYAAIDRPKPIAIGDVFVVTGNHFVLEKGTRFLLSHVYPGCATLIAISGTVKGSRLNDGVNSHYPFTDKLFGGYKFKRESDGKTVDEILNPTAAKRPLRVGDRLRFAATGNEYIIAHDVDNRVALVRTRTASPIPFLPTSDGESLLPFTQVKDKAKLTSDEMKRLIGTTAPEVVEII